MKKVTFAIAAATLAASSAFAVAQQHGGHGAMVAQAQINGLEEKGLVNKSSSGHYTVCNNGHHSVSVTHDDNKTNVAGGDCIGIEAKTVAAAGSDDAARNSVSVHHH